jgi:branched-chain amino acid transport system substrate-binding protein
VSALLEPEPNIKDLRTESLRIIRSKPDGVFLANLNQEGVAAKQLRGLGFKGPFYAALLDQTRINEADGALEGAISAQSPAADPGFVQKYNLRFGMKPTASADTAYDALIALGKAIEAAGGPDPLAVRDALLHVEFQGASGIVKFDDKGGVVRGPKSVIVSANNIAPLNEETR